jgi:hypothetical protein
MSFTKKDRNFRQPDGKLLPSKHGALDETTFVTGMAAALRRAYGGRHSAVKIVAGAVGANERAVRNWFDAKNGPNGEHLVRLVRHSDEMLDSFLALAGKKRFTAPLDIEKARLALEHALAELSGIDTEDT